MQKRPTIQMVAERAGVSRGTVDRVLNNRSYVRADGARTGTECDPRDRVFVPARGAIGGRLRRSSISSLCGLASFCPTGRVLSGMKSPAELMPHGLCWQSAERRSVCALVKAISRSKQSIC